MPINSAPNFLVGNGYTGANSEGGRTSTGARGAALLADGCIVLAGTDRVNVPSVHHDYSTDFVLLCFNADGTLNTSFNGDGRLSTSIGSFDRAYGLAVQADGKFLVAGASEVGTEYVSAQYDFSLARYNSDGSLDTSFGGGDGVLTTALGARSEEGHGVAVQADGRILVAGFSRNGSNNDDFAVVRYNSDGSLDTSFGGGDGIVTTAVGIEHDQGLGAVLQPDGRLLVVGYSSPHSIFDNDFAVVRYNSDGSLDTSFDTDGIVTTAIGAGHDQGRGITLQADGKILVTGYSYNGTNYDIALARYNTDGSLDTSFDGDGILTTAIGTGNERGYSVAVQADGKILVAGSHGQLSARFALARYNSDGSLDTTFGNAGIVTLSFSSAAISEIGHSVLVQPDGKIVFSGEDGESGNLFVARFNADGSLDTRFGLFSTLSDYPGLPENLTAQIDADVQIYDAELIAAGNYGGASLTLFRHGGANAQDLFSATGTLGALSEGGNLTVGGTIIGTVTANSAGTLTLNFNGNATQALVNGAMRQVCYTNPSDTPPASVQLDWTFSDGNSGAQGTGGAASVTGSTTVTIAAANDAPSFGSTLDAAPAYTEGAAAVTLDGNVQVADVELSDAGNFAGARLDLFRSGGANAQDIFSASGTLGALSAGADLTVDGTLIGTVSANAFGRLTLTFNASATQTLVNSALRQIAYSNGSDAPDASVQIDWSFADGNSGAQGSGGEGYAAGHTTVAVTRVNDVPTGAVTVSASARTLTASHDLNDPDGLGTIGYRWQRSTDGGSTWSDIAGATNGTYLLADADNGTRVRVIAGYTDAQGTQETVSSVATSVNDAPVFNGLDAAPAYTEDAAVVALDGNAQVTDAELSATGNYAGASLTLARSGGANAEDVFSASGTLGVLTTGADLIVDGTVIGSVTSNGAGSLTLSFASGATQSLVNSALQQIAYRNSSDTPPTSAQIDWTFSDGNDGAQGSGGAQSVGGHTMIAIAAANDAPTGMVTVSGSATARRTLSAANTLADADGLGSVSYQWQRSTNSGGNWSDIGAATDVTYLLTNADGGTLVRALASYTDLYGTQESVASAPTAPIGQYQEGDTSGNSLTGSSGDDILDGGSGADTLAGGLGDDTYLIDHTGDRITENPGAGMDTARSTVTLSFAPAWAANIEHLTLLGTAALRGTGNALDNSLTGNSAANTLDGGAGNDSLDGAGGVDLLVGGAGNDLYTIDLVRVGTGAALQDRVTEGLNQGSDTVVVRNGLNIAPFTVAATLAAPANVDNLDASGTATLPFNLTGNVLANTLTGNAAANRIDGGAGADSLVGGAGNDCYVIDNVGDAITELSGAGTDSALVSIAATSTTPWQLPANVENATLTNLVAYRLTGNGLDNVLTGNGAINILDGGAGNDTLDGRAGADTLVGGSGDDTYYLDAAGDRVTENADEGTDLVYSKGTRTLADNLENLILQAVADPATGAVLAADGSGNALGNSLTGHAGNNRLYGLAGNDSLSGLAGNDSLDGGAGDDTMLGGLGNDIYVVDSASDVVTEASNQGTDLVQAGLTYSLAAVANVENLTLTGSGNLDGTGNSLANVITGNAGANFLDGGDGVDRLIGGLGNDSYYVDLLKSTTNVVSLQDTVTETAAVGSGTDTLAIRNSRGISLTVAYNVTAPANVENIDLSASGSLLLNASGSAAANRLTGNAGNNTLKGGAGNDIYVAGRGTDVVSDANGLSVGGTDELHLRVDQMAGAISGLVFADLRFSRVGTGSRDLRIDIPGAGSVTVQGMNAASSMVEVLRLFDANGDSADGAISLGSAFAAATTTARALALGSANSTTGWLAVS